MKIFENFELYEFIDSETADARGINNSPTFEVVRHIEELVETILQPLRNAWKKPLIVSSGYRCPALNRELKGVQNSAHTFGYAADIQIVDGDFDEFVNFANDWLAATKTRFDQSIIESSGKTYWWHIAVRNGNGQQRGQIMTIKK